MTPKRSIIDYLALHAQQAPARAAILHQAGTITFGELETLAAKCRGTLAALGVRPGDRIALVMSDGPDMAVALLGVMGLGAIAVPCSTMLRPADLAYQFSDSGARLVIATPEFAAAVREAQASAPCVEAVVIAGETSLTEADAAPLAAFTADTPCLILYTSGSTGKPKGAVHLHGHLSFTVASGAQHTYGLQPEDRMYSAPRLFFAYGLGNSFTLPIGAGCASILSPERPTPAHAAALFLQYRPTLFFAVPTFFRMLLEHCRQGHALDTSSLRFCGSAGELLPASVWHEWKAATGLEIVETIGTTEMLHAFIGNPLGRVRPGSSGMPLRGYEAKLTNDRGEAIAGPGRGNLHARGGSASTHYWNKPDKTAETMHEGWVKTGDVYRRDAEGYFWFEGRNDDLFKCSGMWVSPGEVEDAVCTHPAVLEAAVIAESDESGATVPAAYVAVRPGHAPGDALAAQITEQAATSLPRFKRPRRIHFMERLPRTATGKVQRFLLRALSGAR